MYGIMIAINNYLHVLLDVYNAITYTIMVLHVVENAS